VNYGEGMKMVFKLSAEGLRQTGATPRSDAHRKVRPLAVRSGDMLALKIARNARAAAAEAIDKGVESEPGTRDECSLRF